MCNFKDNNSGSVRIELPIDALLQLVERERTNTVSIVRAEHDTSKAWDKVYALQDQLASLKDELAALKSNPPSLPAPSFESFLAEMVKNSAIDCSSYQGNKKIPAIKTCRTLTGLGLKEAKELVEKVWEKHRPPGTF